MGEFVSRARRHWGKAWTMYKKTVLNNGVRIISERLDHMRSLSLCIWVNAGSRDELEKENGISHFIEHMSFKGTHNRTSLQIAKELDVIGGLSNAFTGKENTCFYARVLGKHFNFLSDILSDIFLNSTYEPGDMERERQVILQEISMVEDTPDDNIHVLFNRLFWMNHPIGMSVLGTNDTVSRIGRENLLEYISKFYVPDRVIIAGAGNVDHESMIGFFGPLFEALEKRGTNCQRETPHSNTGASINYKKLEQVHLCLGGEAPSHTSEKRFACAILNAILGGNMSSRLFQEIRENLGLAYSVYSFLSPYIDTGLLGIYVGTDEKNVNQVLETIRTEIVKVKKGDLSQSDLVSAKEYLIGSIYLSSENPENQMMRIAKNELIFDRYVGYEEMESRLEKVTIDDVVEIAGDIFRDNRVSLATLGPFKKDDLDMGNLQFD